MEFSIWKLIDDCSNEVIERGYHPIYRDILENKWMDFGEWFDRHKFSVITEPIVNQYCDESVGHHLSFKGSTEKEKQVIRATRMLYTYYTYQDFEFRTPTVEYVFDGAQGEVFEAFLSFLADSVGLAHETIRNYRIYLHGFHLHLNQEQIDLNDINADVIEGYLEGSGLTLNLKRNFRSWVRKFLQYCYDEGVTENNLSVLVLKSPKVKDPEKLPTTYKEDEVKDTIKKIDRTSAIGKRNYVIVLLASVYGLRAGDIVTLTFSDIDWKRSMIRFPMEKTGEPIEFELLPEVGNAIIDYIKHGRPTSKYPNVIVSHTSATKGKPLSAPTMHSVTTQYISQAVPNWKEKKHGPHSLRFSLATSLLEDKVDLPMIKTVMGHRDIETTRIYTKVSDKQLRACAIPVSPVTSPYYKKGGCK